MSRKHKNRGGNMMGYGQFAKFGSLPKDEDDIAPEIADVKGNGVPGCGWHTGTKSLITKDCGYEHTNKGYSIVISPAVWGVARSLCSKINDEWQMLLIGSVEEISKSVYIIDYYIPKQEVGAATVRNLECVDEEMLTRLGIVATMHSHAGMGTFFSSTDDEHTNTSIIKHHIVTNNSGDVKAVSQIVLPCGLIKLMDSGVRIDIPVPQVIKGYENITAIHKLEFGYVGGNANANAGIRWLDHKGRSFVPGVDEPSWAEG